MENDLDWLARNVHVWPAGDHQPWCYVYWKGGHRAVSANCITVIQSCVRIEKSEWLARRAELQNKPSWADAPEWANWLAQDEEIDVKGVGGGWFWYERCPTPRAAWDADDGLTVFSGAHGAVLGDWRDTLERRPADLSSAAVIKRLDEATQNVLAAVPALMDEKYSFEPEFMPVSVSNETVQLERPIAVAGTGNGSAAESAFLIGRVIDLLRTSVDHFSADELADLNELTGAELTKRDAAVCGGQKYLDAHWFERGELPPVGTECEFCGGTGDADDPWHPDLMDGDRVTVIAHFECGICTLAAFTFKSRNQNIATVLVEQANYGCFRPIRTERDMAVDEMMKCTLGVMNQETQRRLFEDLYDAGYRKQNLPAK